MKAFHRLRVKSSSNPNEFADDAARSFARETVDDARADDHGRVELEVETEDEASIKLDGRTHFGFGSTASPASHMQKLL